MDKELYTNLIYIIDSYYGCSGYLFQTKFYTLFACEVKFLKDQIKPDIIPKPKDKLEHLAWPGQSACFPVLIHVNGLSEAVIDRGYFAKIIDFSRFLKEL